MPKNIFTAPEYKRGQAVVGATLLFVTIASSIVFGVTRAVFHNLKSATDFTSARSAYYLSEALNEDVAYRFLRGYSVPVNPSLSLGGFTSYATVTDIVGGKEIISAGNWNGFVRHVKTDLSYGTGGSFFYGVQVGEGGLDMANSSSISGNVHSSGPITGSGNLIYGDTISAGPSGSVDRIHATSSMYAHTISNSTVDRNAYYVNISNTTVGGISYPNSPNQATSTLPISDAQITQWETDAAAGGTVTCTGGIYTIDTNTTIGPKKIPCDLVITSNPTVTLTGALWITGNITIDNNVIMRVSSGFLNRTVPVIADKTTDRLNSSQIDLGNSSQFLGSGTNSYILFISQNSSAENGGSVDAIIADNSLTGEVLIYAPHGNITMSNSVSLREVTAYKLKLKNSANVVYKSGLASILFSSGPSGGFNVFDWREVQQ